MVSEFLEKALQKSQIEIPADKYDSFEKYFNLLVEWNEKINLTAITKADEVAVKHFEDSLAVFKYVNIKNNAKIIDVGTGAGFPGIPLKIARDDLNLTLLDSLNKRLVFLQTVCDELNIEAETVHSRAEEGSRKSKYRDSYDYAFSRAVAQLNLLTELCLPYIKKGGYFIALKGPDATEEIENAKKSIGILGGKIKDVIEYNISDNSGRTLVIIEKVKNTPDKYPRHGSKLKSNPL